MAECANAVQVQEERLAVVCVREREHERTTAEPKLEMNSADSAVLSVLVNG